MARTKIPLTTQIINLLTKHHLMTAPKLLDTLLQKGEKYNKTSLYRALDKLVKTEQICKLNFGKNQIWYELRSEHHDHLVCHECGQVEIVECQTTPIHQLKGYLIEHHHLTLFGLCPRCQSKGNAVFNSPTSTHS